MKQLECKQCKRIHELNEDEVIEFNTIISKRNLDPDSIFNMMNAFDGKTCRRGRMHEYGWNYDELDINEIFQKL